MTDYRFRFIKQEKQNRRFQSDRLRQYSQLKYSNSISNI